MSSPAPSAGLIVAAVAVDRVVPIAADQRLDTGATVDRVVPIATVDDRRDDIREGAVALVDAYEVVARLGIDHDRAESVAVEAEVGRAVITDVDEENVWVPRLEAKRDLVGHRGAFDGEQATVQLGLLELTRSMVMRAVVGRVAKRCVSVTGERPGSGGQAGNDHGR